MSNDVSRPWQNDPDFGQLAKLGIDLYRAS